MINTNANGSVSGFAAGLGAFNPGDTIVFQLTGPGGAVLADCRTTADASGNADALLPGSLQGATGMITIDAFDITSGTYAETSSMPWQ